MRVQDILGLQDPPVEVQAIQGLQDLLGEVQELLDPRELILL